MMTDLNALSVFAKVAETSSFSEAARRLQMPLSTVSRRIAELENQLGVRLLERSTRLLRLTDIGSELYQHARASLQLRAAVDQAVSDQLGEVSGLLRLSAPPHIADAVLAPVMCAFQEAYPRVRVRAVIAERHLDHIADEVDLAFRVGPLKDSSLVARTLMRYRHRLVASPRYLGRAAPPSLPSDLARHRLLGFSPDARDCDWRFTHVSKADQETLTFAPALAMNDYAGLTAALLMDAGIGELPPMALSQLLAQGKLVEVLPEWRLAGCDLSLVHLGNRHIARPVSAFNEFATRMVPTLFPRLPG